MFDFAFFQGEKLIKEENKIPYKKDVFKTAEIQYNHNEKKLIRETSEYTFVIDLNNNGLHLKLVNGNYEGKMQILKSSIVENENIIEITYQIDEKEPVNKIIITRRENER